MKKTVWIIVLVLIAHLAISNCDILEASQLTSKKIVITEHDPQGATTMVKDVPTKSGGKLWLYILGAAVIVGGLAALAGGGTSSSDSDGSSSSSTPTTGNFEATW